MIESVQARHRGAFHFEDHYDNLCALQDTAPLPAVKAHLSQGVIDLNGDRIRLNDWMPIINTVKINKSIQFIAVRSYYQMPKDDTDEKRAAILRRKLPSIGSKEITHRLVKSLKDCLFVSPTLSCIELQGLALRERDLQVLVKGIVKSQTLRHLSLEHCRIGDQGLETLCKGLKNTKFINSVNLSGCSLSHRGAEALAAVIKHQGMQRHNEAWRDSLRYRRPDLDRMSGIRRITANNNPMLGDEGSKFLAEALKDDLWLKALDLQACGVSSSGSQSFLEVLKFNTTLVVLDLRRNPLIDRDVMHSVMEQLMLNSNGEDGEYKWVKAEEPEDNNAKLAAKQRRRTTKVLNSSMGKKTTIKVTPTSSRKRARMAAASARRTEIAKSPGLPWRTAQRANRFRGHGPEMSKFVSTRSADTSALGTSGDGHILMRDYNTNNDYDEIDDSVTDADVTMHRGADVVVQSDYENSRMTRIKAEADAAYRKLEESHLSLDLNNQKDVRIELEGMRRHLKEERLARARADQRVMQLMIDNRRLTEEVNTLKKVGVGGGGRGSTNATSLLEDEVFLKSIEVSFKQFHAFIDMLKDAGLEQLVSMAGLDQAQMPFGSNGARNTNIINNNSSNGYTSKPDSNKHIFTNGLPDTPKSSNPNTTYANVPLASSTFMTSHGQPRRTEMTWGQSLSMGDSYMEETPVVIGGDGHKGGASHRSKAYDDQSELAKMEADELYTRLVQETRGVLDADKNGGSAQGSQAEVISLSSKPGTPPTPKERTHFGVARGDVVRESLESYEDPSSYISDRGDMDEARTPRSPGAGEDSQEEDF